MGELVQIYFVEKSVLLDTEKGGIERHKKGAELTEAYGKQVKYLRR